LPAYSISVSLPEAAEAAARKDEIEYAAGMTCGLYPANGGTTVTEIQAGKSG
jgi:hypothetical protein